MYVERTVGCEHCELTIPLTQSSFGVMQTSQGKMQAFLAAVGGMVQYAREDEAVQLKTVSFLSLCD